MSLRLSHRHQCEKDRRKVPRQGHRYPTTGLYIHLIIACLEARLSNTTPGPCPPKAYTSSRERLASAQVAPFGHFYAFYLRCTLFRNNMTQRSSLSSSLNFFNLRSEVIRVPTWAFFFILQRLAYTDIDISIIC